MDSALGALRRPGMTAQYCTRAATAKRIESTGLERRRDASPLRKNKARDLAPQS
jgi:hypothetical protein